MSTSVSQTKRVAASSTAVIISLILAIAGVRMFQTSERLLGAALLLAAIGLFCWSQRKTPRAILAITGVMLIITELQRFRFTKHPIDLLLVIVLAVLLIRRETWSLTKRRKLQPTAQITNGLVGLLLIGLGVAFAGFVWYPPLDDGLLLLAVLTYSFPLAVLLTIGGLHIAKRMAAPRTLKTGLPPWGGILALLLLSTMACLFLFGGSALLLNGVRDPSPPTTHVARIINRYTSHHRGGWSYHVQVESWRPSHTMEVLDEVPLWVYDQATPNGRRCLRIVTKAGRLGFEWVVSYHIQETLYLP